MAYQARIHIAELQGTRNISRHCAWLSASGLTVRPAGMTEPVAIATGFTANLADLDSKQAALGGSAI